MNLSYKYFTGILGTPRLITSYPAIASGQSVFLQGAAKIKIWNVSKTLRALCCLQFVENGQIFGVKAKKTFSLDLNNPEQISVNTHRHRLFRIFHGTLRVRSLCWFADEWARASRKKRAFCLSQDEKVDVSTQGPWSAGDLWGQVKAPKMINSENTDVRNVRVQAIDALR